MTRHVIKKESMENLPVKYISTAREAEENELSEIQDRIGIGNVSENTKPTLNSGLCGETWPPAF